MSMNRIEFKNTRFIFATNLSGDPARSPRFHSTARTANVIIPNEEDALAMLEDGFNVKQTKPREGEEDGFIPEYFVAVKLNYNAKRPPNVYLISGRNQVLLDENTVGQIDDMRVQSVNVICNPYKSDASQYTSLYVNSMQVIQDIADDPYALEYQEYLMQRNGDSSVAEDEEIPF